MKKHYYPVYDLRNIGFALQEVEIIKEVRRTHYSVTAKTIWSWGVIDPKIGNNFVRKTRVCETLDEALDVLNQRVEELCQILESRKKDTLQNVLLAKEILQEEKREAKEAGRRFKTYSSRLKNLDIKYDLEKRGLLWDQQD